MSESRVIVALDFSHADAALKLALTLNPAECKLKVGKELFVAAGPKLVENLVRLGFDVFLDLKFHDIPNTVAAACRAAASLGVWMINVHASGGCRMLSAARAAVGEKPKLIAITVLTSLEDEDLQQIGILGKQDEVVLRWAKLAHATGLDGVVCSAHEVKLIKRELGANFLAITPGIRLDTSDIDDQRRIALPKTAIQNGSDYLVIGRPIVQAQDPRSVLRQVNREIESVIAT